MCPLAVNPKAVDCSFVQFAQYLPQRQAYRYKFAHTALYRIEIKWRKISRNSPRPQVLKAEKSPLRASIHDHKTI
jgi:hypothetical protein